MYKVLFTYILYTVHSKYLILPICGIYFISFKILYYVNILQKDPFYDLLDDVNTFRVISFSVFQNSAFFVASQCKFWSVSLIITTKLWTCSGSNMFKSESAQNWTVKLNSSKIELFLFWTIFSFESIQFNRWCLNIENSSNTMK